MRRIRYLINATKASYPNDTFFDNLDKTLRLSPQARAQYRAYDRALSFLDENSWTELSRKAVAHFMDHREGQLKQGFFNQLNDAFAYQFLARQGYTDIAILREDKKAKTPDLSYKLGNEQRYCEVKSVGISDEEIARFNNQQAFDSSIYMELPAGFFRKLDSLLASACAQITSKGNTGLAFIVVRFDDFTLAHYESYRKQIVQYLSQHPAPEIYVKVGILGRKRIHKHARDNVNT